jgi:hypothetical protein
VAGTAEDPLTADRLVDALADEGIDGFANPRRGGSVDALTSPANPWWEIRVPEEWVARAQVILEKERANIESGAEDAARAAEEEEAEGERSQKTGPTPPQRAGGA